MCAYVDANGGGPAMRAYYSNSSWNGSWGNYNNSASSIWNNGNSQNVNVYVNQNYSGSNFTVYRGTGNRHTDLYWDQTGGVGIAFWNDNLESNLWT
ncbi:hypothetical protein HNR13_004073 [Leifsonia shinshuensis]|uniref:Uncharacterized protein n=2 Tax=Leifsonia shinshuensis TaxID=150026 RepID=A0A853CXD9_9MICO|nr:hypothetical protein [Leifsonia shinshuensis]